MMHVFHSFQSIQSSAAQDIWFDVQHVHVHVYAAMAELKCGNPVIDVNRCFVMGHVMKRWPVVSTIVVLHNTHLSVSSMILNSDLSFILV